MIKSLLRMGLLSLVAACMAAGAGTDTLGDGMRKCARETDQTQRLACFDALANTLPKIEADKFGMTANIEQKREPPEKRWVKPEALTAKIRSLKESARGTLIFSLDNDQVWIQDQPSSNIRFSVGEQVRIEHGALTSLWLVADHGRKTRVKRLS
jgi:hypothetical protein